MRIKQIWCLLLCLTFFLGILTGCGTAAEDPAAETNTPTSESQDPEAASQDPEVAEAMALFALPEGWTDDLDAQVSCAEMAGLLETMLSARLDTPSEVTLSWLNSPEWAYDDVCYRGQAAYYIYRLALENYFGIENAQETWQYDAFAYIHSLAGYHNRVGTGLPCLELKLFNEGSLPENEAVSFDVWSAVYCTAQIDLTNSLTIFDVDENGAMGYEKPITRKEAILACKRLYNAYMDITPVPVSSVEKLEFTEEQLAKAMEMPDASWDNLPAWNGMCIELTQNSGYMCEKDFALRQQYGIDFARIFINNEIFQWNGEEMVIPRYWLDNFDDAVNWAIEYGVHLCFLVDEEGFAGAAMDVAGFYDDELLERLIQCYQMLARRYADLPNSIFSLNIFNEPWMLTLDDEEIFAARARQVIGAIREYGEDRLIFVDGLEGSQQPVYSLAEDRVAQSTHMYGPDSLFTAGWSYDAWWYAGQQWPFDYVTAFLFSSGEGYTLTGTFPEGLQMQILLRETENANGELRLYADGELLDTHTVDENNLAIMGEFLPLPHSAQELRLEWSGTTGICVLGMALVYPEAGEEPVPRIVSPWNEGKYSDTLCENKIVQIVCEMDFAFDETYTNPVIAVSDDGSYTVTHDGGARYTFGKEYYRDMLQKWVQFSQETGAAVMVQEWGPYADAYISQEAALGIVSAGAEAMQEAGFPCCIWVDMLHTAKKDITPQTDGGYRINTEMIELLQACRKG